MEEKPESEENNELPMWIIYGLLAILVFMIGIAVGIYLDDDTNVVEHTVYNTKEVLPAGIQEKLDDMSAKIDEMAKRDNPDYVKCDPDWDFDCSEDGYKEKEWWEK